jgi:hypothetical protein
MRELAVFLSLTCATIAVLRADITLIVAALILGCVTSLSLRART